MPIGQISNGDSGLSSRNKLNQVIDFVDNYNANPPMLADILGNSNKTGGNDIISDDSNSVASIINGQIFLYSGTTNAGGVYLSDGEAYLYNNNGGFCVSEGAVIIPNYFQVKNAANVIKHGTKNTFDSLIHEFNNTIKLSGLDFSYDGNAEGLVTINTGDYGGIKNGTQYVMLNYNSGYIEIHSAANTKIEVSSDNGGRIFFTAPGIESNATVFFTGAKGIDTTATAGTDVLNIGATNADVINYGSSNTQHFFLGVDLKYNGLNVATENYVDNLIAGLKFKEDVIAASTGNVNVSAAPSSIDGVSLTVGDRVLLKNQTTASQNGVYVFMGVGHALVRATDSNAGDELVSATYPVRSGTVNQDTWYTVTNDSITIGATNILFSQVAGAGTYTVGSYLKLTGNVFDVDFTTFSTTQITEGTNLYFTDARACAAILTGFSSGAGTISASDSILTAINKLNGNIALKADTVYVDSRYLFKVTSDSTIHTGTLSNTIIWSEDISNKLSSGDIAELISDVVRVSGSTAATIRFYLNSSASLTGATQIAIYTYGFSGLNIVDFRRCLIVKSSTVIRVKGSVSSILNDYGAFSNYTDVTVNLASLHVIFAITLGNTGDQFLVSSRKMSK